MEMKIEPNKTYKTRDNARAAVVKSGDDGLRYFIMQDEETGRFFPVFRVTEAEMAETGIHFRWTVV